MATQQEHNTVRHNRVPCGLLLLRACTTEIQLDHLISFMNGNINIAHFSQVSDSVVLFDHIDDLYKVAGYCRLHDIHVLKFFPQYWYVYANIILQYV